MKKKYDKLIRDKIPKIIKESGKNFEIEETKGEKLLKYIKEKIVEENSELISAKSKEDIVNEFADVFEILDKYRMELDISNSEISEARKNKNKKRGKFKKNFVLKWTK